MLVGRVCWILCKLRLGDFDGHVGSLHQRHQINKLVSSPSADAGRKSGSLPGQRRDTQSWAALPNWWKTSADWPSESQLVLQLHGMTAFQFLEPEGLAADLAIASLYLDDGFW